MSVIDHMLLYSPEAGGVQSGQRADGDEGRPAHHHGNEGRHRHHQPAAEYVHVHSCCACQLSLKILLRMMLTKIKVKNKFFCWLAIFLLITSSLWYFKPVLYTFTQDILVPMSSYLMSVQ